MDLEYGSGILNGNVVRIVQIFGNEPLYFNQICELSRIKSRNNLLKNLNMLVESGVLRREHGKNNTFYSLERTNPLCASLIRLINVMKTSRLARDKWYAQGCNATPIHLMSAGRSAVFLKEKTGLAFSAFLYDVKDDTARMMYRISDLERLSSILIDKLKKNPKYFEEIKEEYDSDLEEIYNLFREIDSKNMKNVSDDELFLYVKRAVNALGYSVGVGHAIEPFSLLTDNILKDKIAKYIPDKLELNEKFVILTTPVQESFSQQSEDFLHSIALSKNKDELADEYIKKFYWIRNSYAGRHIFTRKEVLEEAELLKDRKKINNDEVTNKKEEILKKYNFSKDVLVHLNATEFITYWQDERKKHILIAVDYMDKLLEELSARTGIDINLLRYLLPSEVNGNIIKMKEELEDRRKGSLFFQSFESTENTGVVTGKDFARIRTYLDEHESAETKVINGTAASLGTVRGRVKVCITIESLAKVEQGDVLVASMTRPEYLPAMKKAAAFVTDEGGITCHASIVAREMRKPCVIGTRNATKILKDGDLVEVKGNHGQVVIIERNQN